MMGWAGMLFSLSPLLSVTSHTFPPFFSFLPILSIFPHENEQWDLSGHEGESNLPASLLHCHYLGLSHNIGRHNIGRRIIRLRRIIRVRRIMLQNKYGK